MKLFEDSAKQTLWRIECLLITLGLAVGAWAAPPPGYYDSVDATNASTLRTTLHDVIDDHVRYPYTSGSTDTWDILELADEDPNNASRVLDIYKNESYAKQGGGNTFYNREHSWPKSYGFPDDTSSNYPYTDCHHLFLCNDSYNSSRGNKYSDYCLSGCSEYPTDINNGWGGGSGTYPGNSNWADANSWEVWMQRRGDIARAMFYMDVRYEGGSHGGTGANEPDLILTNNAALIQTTGSNTSGAAYMGLLSTLLQWHIEDPVDALEQQRNDTVYSFQGNRNPFVDHPEWVACIFSGSCGGPDTTPPSPPLNLIATGGDGTVSLDWADNLEGDLAGYHVYRSTTSGSGYSLISGMTPVANSNYIDNTVTNSVTYYYVVTAVDTSSNESGNSNQDSATPMVDNTPPSAPLSLMALGGDGLVDLDWPDSPEGDLAGYNVYRSTTMGAAYSQVNGSLVGNSAYQDSTVTNGVTYYYVVTAVDISSNESGNSPEASATPMASGGGSCPELFFSEYVEGSSNNKAYEVFNPTGAAVDLSEYTVELYNNGASTPNSTVTLGPGTLASEATWVVVNSSSTASLAALGDQISSTTNYNGDDALVLKHNGAIIDSIGQVGFDPGTNWSNGGVATSEQTLRRKVSITEGDAVANDAFDPSVEWDSFPQDTFSGLGSHTYDGCASPPAAPLNLIASPGNGLVDLDWADNMEPDLAGYYIYRSTSPSVTVTIGNRLDTIGTASNYQDNSITNGITYYYVVTARNTALDESGASNEVSATPQDPGDVSGDVTPGPVTPPSMISSLRTTWFDAPYIFSFVVDDDAMNPGADVRPLLIESIRIDQGAADELGNWQHFIAGAMLSDGMNSVNATVNSSSLDFTLPTGVGAIGHIPDNGSKIYLMKVWFKQSTSNPTNFDNYVLGLALNSTGISTASTGSSGIGFFTPVETNGGQLLIDVDATELRFSTQPADGVVGSPISASVEATDMFGNRDSDAMDSVMLSLLTDSGTILSATTGLTKSLSGGVVDWTDLQVDQGEAGLHLSASATGLANERSGTFSISPSGGGAGTPVFINEFHYDDDGGDAGEFIEVAGPAGTDLSGWSIVLYNGSGGAVYDTDSLPSPIPDLGSGYGVVSISYPTNGIQNGSPDGIVLYDGSSVVQFLSYEGSFTASDGVANGMTSTDIGVFEDAVPEGQSLQLSGTGSVYEDFTWNAPAANTQNAINTGQTFQAPGGSLNDNGVFQFASHIYETTETAGTFSVTIERLAGTTGSQDVSFAVDGSSTASGVDYSVTTASPIMFLAGETSKTIELSIADDTDHLEGDESIVLNLTGVTGGGELGIQMQCTVTILGSRKLRTPGSGNPIPANYADGVRARVDFNNVSISDNVEVTLYRDPLMATNIGSSLDVVWQVEPQGGFAFGGDVLVTFQYLDSEATGLNEANLQLVKGPTPNGPWESVSQQFIDTGANEISGIVTGFSFFTASDNTTLDVTLERFAATEVSPGDVIVSWITSSEIGSAGFYVWRGGNNRSGLIVPTERLSSEIIPAAGGGDFGSSYEFSDPQIIAPDEQRYYFLEEVELDGTTNFHGPASLRGGNNATSVFGWELY